MASRGKNGLSTEDPVRVIVVKDTLDGSSKSKVGKICQTAMVKQWGVADTENGESMENDDLTRARCDESSGNAADVRINTRLVVALATPITMHRQKAIMNLTDWTSSTIDWSSAASLNANSRSRLSCSNCCCLRTVQRQLNVRTSRFGAADERLKSDNCVIRFVKNYSYVTSEQTQHTLMTVMCRFV